MPVTAQQDDSERPRSAVKTQSPDDTGPSLEFLEFLGTWETSSGEWVDPTEVQSEDWPVLSGDTSRAKEPEIGNAN